MTGSRNGGEVDTAISAPVRRSTVYKENFRFVWNCLRRFGVASADLEDATHDVFVVVFRRGGESEPSNGRGWLFGVVRRVAANYRRGVGRRARRLAAVRDVQPRATRPERDLERTDAARIVGRFLEGLAEPQRDVFVLMELQQMTAREVGDVLDLNPNTASARLRAARKAFDRFAADVRRENGWDGEAAVAHLQQPVGIPSDARKRVGVALGVSLAPVSQVATAGALSWAKIAAMSVALGGGGLAALAGLASAMRVPSSHAAVAPSRVAVEREPASPVVGVATLPQTAEPEGVAPPTVDDERPPIAARPRRSRRYARVGGGRPRESETPATAPQVNASDPIEAQTELLAQARRALTRGDAGGALLAVAEYRQDFSSGPFLAEMELLEIRAHCRVGDESTARTLAERFERAHPGSSHLAMLDKTCAGSVTKSQASGN